MINGKEILTIEFNYFDKNGLKNIQEIISDFASENSCEIKINYGKGNYSYSDSTFHPDIICTISEDIAELNEKTALYAYNTQNTDSSLNKQLLNECYIANRLIAMPWAVDPWVLFINAELLSKSGFTGADISEIDGLNKIASAMYSPPKHYGLGLNVLDKENFHYILNYYSANMDSDLFTTFKMNKTNNIKALSRFLNLACASSPGSDISANSDFLNGRAAMHIARASFINTLSLQNNIQYEMKNLPGKIPALLYTASISEECDNQKLAEKFVKMLIDQAPGLLGLNPANNKIEQNTVYPENFLAKKNNMLIFPEKNSKWKKIRKTLYYLMAEIMKNRPNAHYLIKLYDADIEKIYRTP